MNKFFKGLPFRKMVEKISPETRAKHPLLSKMIPYANTIGGIILMLLLALVLNAIGFDRIESFINKITGLMSDSQNILDQAGQIAE